MYILDLLSNRASSQVVIAVGAIVLVILYVMVT